MIQGAQVDGYSQPYGIYTREGQPYPEHRMPFVRALEEKQLVVVDDITIHRPDGTRVEVRAFARPINVPITRVINASSTPRGRSGAEQARAESDRRLQLAQRLEAIGTLAGGIAHDFNNLIFGIKLLASELATTEIDPRRKESLALIDEITERSAALTRSLLGFARRGKHRSEPVSLDDMIMSMTELLKRTVTGVVLEFELLAEDRGTVQGDRSQLEQVVTNLVLNARDAVRGGGRVRGRTRTVVLESPPSKAIGLASIGRYVVLEISDDGPGISDELRERVFEPYLTTKDKGQDREARARRGARKYRLCDGRGGGRPRRGRDLPGASSRVACGRTRHGDAGHELEDHLSSPPRDRSDVPVILMSGYTLDDEVQEILDLGVRAFMTKAYSVEALARALAAL